MMKIIPGFKVRGFILAAAFSAGLGFATSASAQVRSYLVDLNSKTVTDIGTLGGTYSAAFGINDAGQVVGVSNTAGGYYHAFITGPNGMGMRDLSPLGSSNFSSADGINASGQVVGSSDRGNFITGPDGMGMRYLGFSGSLYDINDVGQVVGVSDFPPPTGESHAFITGPDGVGIRDLGTLGGDFSRADAVNDIGQVVGQAHTAGGASHAFITGPDGMGMRDLGTLVGGIHSFANDINAAGQVVGQAHTAGGTPHAFITGPDGMGMRDLGTLGGTESNAYGINAAGQVVGSSFTAGDVDQIHAFITGPDGMGMMDLNSLVDVPRGVILVQAIDINNSGQVVAYGDVTVIPEPEIYALFLAGLALVGFVARRKKMGGEAFSPGQVCS